jgi:hypothetical protein
MRVHNFHVLTSCPKNELHQWFIGLYGEHIIPVIVYRYTTALQRPDLIKLDKHGEAHPIISNEAVARVFRRLADRLQAVVTDMSMMTITPEFSAHFLEDLLLRINGTKESHGARKLYEPSPVPTLYVGKVEDILGRVPLFPCFLDGNIHDNFHYSIQICSLKSRYFAFGCADRPLQG